MQLIGRGKVKDIYRDNDHLVFVFSDRISVFDKVIPNEVPSKGEVLCRCAAHWFRVIDGMGMNHHYLSSEKNSMKVRRVDVITDYSQLNHSTKSYLIPVEVICRHYVAGSLHDRLKKGRIAPEDLGLGSIPEYGEPLPEPFIEFTTKLEEHDRSITEEEALEISGMTREELDTVKEWVLRIDERMARDVRPRGLIHVDGKKEFAFDGERNLMVIDTFGTPDEDRFWDVREYENGRYIELSKEFVRQYYRSTGYHEELQKAREAGQREPEIPPLPQEMVEQVQRVYVDLYERITGEGW